MPETKTLPRSVTFTIGTQTKVCVLPLHGGHHAMWASPYYQADICNMTDDWVVRDQTSGLLYRFPIVPALYPWSEKLIAAMNDYDRETGNPWAGENGAVRAATLHSALHRQGDRPFLCTFSPGYVTPAMTEGTYRPDYMLERRIYAHPECIVSE